MLLYGRELAGYIKQRHYKQIRSLGFAPKLAIVISTQADAATRSYVRSSKSRYGEDIGAIVEVHEIGKGDEVIRIIKELNADEDVHGIIVQLPFAGIDTDLVLRTVDPSKDVDGLHPQSSFDPATPKAIFWLLSSYGIDWAGKSVTVVGQGRLVGKPISTMLENSRAQVTRCDITTKDLAAETRKADMVISAVGKPNLIKPGMVKPGAVVIDAGTAEMDGNLVGDASHELYEDDSIKITPNPGGVGPMTVAALFDNLLLAASGNHPAD